MINNRSIQAVDKSRFGPFSKPLYDSYCFSNIPGTVQQLLTQDSKNALPIDTIEAKEYDYVVVMLIDSFGWQYFQKFAPKYPFLQRFFEQGIVSKITSQFPSTTTNHVTCMHTGLSVGQSGLYEWFYYEPLVDACICPLHYSYIKDVEFNTLAKDGILPKDLFPFRTIYQDFKERGIRSIAFQEKNTAKSPYSQAMYQGAELVSFLHVNEGLAKLAKAIRGVKEKTYLFFYFGDIDSAGHAFGPNSPEVEIQVDKCFSSLEKFWQELQSKKEQDPNLATKKGCMILTADHGMAPIHPDTTWFINKNLPDFERFIKRNKNEELLVPCGSSRDMFLHIKDECLDEAYNILTKALTDIAQVHKTSDLITQGFFGPVTDRLLERLGNICILPLGEHSVWWYDPAYYDNPKYGHHGGLSQTELETIFLFQNL